RPVLLAESWCFHVSVPARTTACLSFFFHDPPPTELYTLSLHDALPISCPPRRSPPDWRRAQARRSWRRIRCLPAHWELPRATDPDRKSTRLNSSHVSISYAVFCLKKKKSESKMVELIAFALRVVAENTD